MELEDVKSVGPKRAQKLKEADVESVEKLANLHPSEIEKKIDVSSGVADEISRSAKGLIREEGVEMATASDLGDIREERLRRIPTGVVGIDKIFDGGIETNAITSIYGPSSTGKTQFVLQLCVNCVGKLDEEAIFIETEPDVFRVDRIKGMAEGSQFVDDPDKVLEKVKVFPSSQVPDVHALYNLYQKCAEYADNNDVGMLVIDSFSAPFRQQFYGREQLSDQAKEQRRHFPELQYISDEYNVSVILTHQAYGIPDSDKQKGQIARTGSEKAPVGGHFPQHSSTFNISLKQEATNRYEMEVWGAPHIGRETGKFKVTEDGLEEYD